ncbi:MAG: hypothetical protein ACOY40_07395 [Bacillota bacterium]
MFMSIDKLTKIAVGSVVTSFLTFATLMPAFANNLQTKVDSNSSIAVHEEVQEDSLYPSQSDRPDKAAALINFLKNGLENGSRQILVWPKANHREQTTICHNGAHEAAATTGQEQAANEEAAAPAGQEQAVDEEAAASADEEEAANEEAAAPADKEEAVDEEAAASADKEEAVNEEAAAPAGQEQAVDEEAAASTDKEEAVNEEAAAPADKEEAVNEEAAASADEKKSVNEAVYGPADEEKVQIGLYTRLLNSYDRLVSIFEKLLGFWGTTHTN